MTIDRYELGLLIVGLAALLAAWIPVYLSRRPLSLPIVLVAVGASVFALPLGLGPVDPRSHLELVERVTEFGVIVALMGAGLKLDRPLSLRGWSTTWRMLAVAMPLTIVTTLVMGVAVGGLAATSALLLGAVIAPTDPVLASDVQVGEPTTDAERAPSAEDEVRFTLTAEGGLNDALAFPFVYAAVAIAGEGWGGGRFLEWFAWDLIGRIVIALLVGWAIGRALGVIAFRRPGGLSALASTPQGFLAVAATLIAYGATELLQGYGFLAVFVAAVALRGSERHAELHLELHGFAEQTENLLVVGLLLAFGGALVGGVLDPLTWTGAFIALLLVFVVRPLTGLVALVGSPLTSEERWAISFFGVRGIGSVYYLAYALTAAEFADADLLWAIVAATLLVSIAAHGVTASPLMRLVDRASHRRLVAPQP